MIQFLFCLTLILAPISEAVERTEEPAAPKPPPSRTRRTSPGVVSPAPVPIPAAIEKMEEAPQKAEEEKPAEAVVTSNNKIKQTSENSISRKGLSIDYNSWFENIRIVTTNPYQAKALMYGVGVSYEHSVYKPKWGYGLHGGYVHTYAVAGSSGNTSQYYARRVPVSVLRGGVRLFYRLSGRFDLGVIYQAQLNKASWPEFNGMTVAEDSSVSTGTFFDSRWRLNSKWDLIQSVGMYSKGTSGIWRLGAVYAF